MSNRGDVHRLILTNRHVTRARIHRDRAKGVIGVGQSNVAARKVRRASSYLNGAGLRDVTGPRIQRQTVTGQASDGHQTGSGDIHRA